MNGEQQQGFLRGLTRDLRVVETPEGLRVGVPVEFPVVPSGYRRFLNTRVPEPYVAMPVPVQPTRQQLMAEVVDNPIIDLLLGAGAFALGGGLGGPAAVRYAAPLARRALIGGLSGGIYGGSKALLKGDSSRLAELPDDVMLFALFESLLPIAGRVASRGAGAFKRFVDRYGPLFPEVFL